MAKRKLTRDSGKRVGVRWYALDTATGLQGEWADAARWLLTAARCAASYTRCSSAPAGISACEWLIRSRSPFAAFRLVRLTNADGLSREGEFRALLGGVVLAQQRRDGGVGARAARAATFR